MAARKEPRLSQTYNCMNPTFEQAFPSQNGDKHTIYQNNMYDDLITSPTSPATADSTVKRFEPWPTQKIIVTGINKKTKCCIAVPNLLVLLFGLILGGVISLCVMTYLDMLNLRARVETLSSDLSTVQAVQSSNQDVKSLLQMIQDLELKMNETTLQLEGLKFNCSAGQKRLEASVSREIEDVSLNISIQLNSLQSSIDNLTNVQNETETELNSLQDELNTTQNKVIELQLVVRTIDVNETSLDLSSLQSSVDTLTTRVNSPVNLYQGCIQETSSCNVSTNGASNYYRAECGTPRLPIVTEGNYTSDIRCEYEADQSYTEAAILRRHGDEISCECDVVWVHLTANEHTVLPGNLSGTCTLVVTRCPEIFKIP